MRTMLLVEDASFFEKAIVDRLQDIGRHQIMVARNFSEAESCLDMPICEPDLALVDLTLPDAPNGEIVDLCRNRNIPTIIFTSKFDNEVREKALAKGVIDYVLKDTPASLDYVAELLKRLSYNPKIGILILDDSSVDRERIAQITSHHLYQTYQASTPAEALQMLRDHQHIRLVLADYYMPDEDGFAFLKTVRRKYSRERLSVIGMSSLSNSDNRIRFLKYGAADFIDKSYAPEEILLRISLNLDMMDRIAELNTLAMQDALTGVHNRHFLFTKAVKQIESWAHSGNKASWIAVFDLDSFKQINDEYGHDVGDSVLLGFARQLRALAGPEDMIIRLGGDEFCMIFRSETRDSLTLKLAGFMKSLSTHPIRHSGTDLLCQTSVGIAKLEGGEISDALSIADKHLYASKRSGFEMLAVASDG
ncbi:GGDEF domain-containing response regulator [Roseibium sp.]|uniref:GGDEF domain-containing response regulator n=1 Tax=Roseibium sp. TaxID=1936156 RepID=UPI003D118123